MIMAVFNDERTLYEILGGFFDTKVRVVEEAHLIHQVGGTIAFVFQRPDAEIRWIPEDDSSAERPFHLAFGGQGPSPLLTFRQDGDTAHRFWLGYLDLQQALARQQVRAQGPLSRAMKLIPHLDAIYPLYPPYLESIGRGDLILPRAGARL